LRRFYNLYSVQCPLRVDAVEKVADDLRERFHLAF
jgi:hypothetical protein